jgi:hypothetical protein
MEINFTREFIKSKTNIVIALSTLGLGFMCGEWYTLVLGIIIYGLSIMFIPEMPWFKNKITNEYQEIEKENNEKEKQVLIEKRNLQLSTLQPTRKDKYYSLAETCSKIEENTDNSSQEYESIFRKLEELLSTYLKLLIIEQSLQLFVESEKKEDIESCLKDSQKELLDIEKEKLNIQKDPLSSPMQLESKQKLFDSKQDKIAILNQRKNKLEQAKTNIEIVLSELDRLEQQIKLIRSDSIATRNTDALTNKIDVSIEQINQTNKWLGEMQDFKDVVGDDCQTQSKRIGFLKSPDNSMFNNLTNNKIKRAKNYEYKSA